jgi:hypothetical protein
VFVNRVLRRIFGPERDEIIGGWRKLHNEKLHNLCSLPVIIRLMKSRRMRWVGNVVHAKEERSAYRLLVEELKCKRPVGRPRHRWEHNMMNLRETGWGGMDWIDLA